MLDLINRILEEDEGYEDITANAVIDEDLITNAKIFSKDEGILAGIDIIKDFLLSKNIEIKYSLEEGSKLSKNDTILELKGNARELLLVERTILNILMRMSGVATNTNKVISLIKNAGYNVIIAGTRKTSPGIAKLDKYALKIGGADPHRFSLDDMALIKDNHIAIVGKPVDALKKAQLNVSFSKKIEVEVETFEDAINCVKEKADIVMLDNMSPVEIREIINELDYLNIRENSLIEVSGGIDFKNILDYACLDVDIISLGYLTHSTRSLNFSMNIVL